MIGPKKVTKKTTKNVCLDCEMLIKKELGGTKIFPKKRTVHYCKHPDLGANNDDIEVCFLRYFPNMPKWCPEWGKGMKP